MGGGERLLKDIYEALRAGPGWNHTLLWVGYDDAGGFYDHVVPPFEGVPSPDHPCHVAPVCLANRVARHTVSVSAAATVPATTLYQWQWHDKLLPHCEV